jgi:hypothetical protein
MRNLVREFIRTSPTKHELTLFWGAAIAIFFFLWIGMMWWGFG